MQGNLPLLPNEPSASTADEAVFTLDYPQAELVFGLVYAVGTDYKPVQYFLEDQIRLAGYKPSSIQISDCFRETAEKLNLDLSFSKSTEYERIDGHIKAGNRIRANTNHADIFALIASSKIYSTRQFNDNEPSAHSKIAHVIASLKRPEEVETLRKIYGPGFYLVGIFAGEAERLKFLSKRKGLDEEYAKDLIKRDQKEDDPFGQRTRDTFQMADVFVGTKNDEYENGLRRFTQLVFGDPFITPTRDEHAMFLAYAASLRSGDLSRQVGAAINCADGDVISLGCNDVPAPGGGLYWEDDGTEDQRDHKKGHDANDTRKAEIIDDIIQTFRKNFLPDSDEKELLDKARPILRKTLLSEITEFGRSVHAEMEALTAAGRTGVSFRNATLYTTTFPCHTCSRHIVAAGISRLVYIEPYPKSLAPKLHADAIRLMGEDNENPETKEDKRIPFEPFLGVGPRRFFDLFSLKLSSGYTIERKLEGKKLEWDIQHNAKPRVPMPPTSYLEREQLISRNLDTILGNINGTQNERPISPSGEERGGILEIASDHSASGRKLAGLEDGLRNTSRVEQQPKQDAG